MVELPLLEDLFVVFALAIGVTIACQRAGVPTVVGFLVTGVLAGPSGLALVENAHEVEAVAEVGVIFLLFTIGLEFSLADLVRIRKLVLVGGALQVCLTVLATWAVATAFGLPWRQGVFLGFLCSLSSTAIVLRVIQERGEMSAPHGRAVLGVLIFQDVIVVPMMLLTPILAGGEGDVVGELLLLGGKGVGIVAAVLLGSRLVVPWLLRQIARTRSNEMFLLGVVVICFGVAGLTQAMGLSLALGAFLAGLILSDSDFGHRALGNVLPFRDVFTSVFFVSVGMLLDLEFAAGHPIAVLLGAAAVMLVKALLAGLACAVLGLSLRVSLLSGLALAQVGEFSFVLSRTGVEHDLIGGDMVQGFVVTALVTMAATPFVISGSQRLATWVASMPLPESLLRGRMRLPAAARATLRDHIVVVGYGVIGRNVARSAKLARIPYTIVEINHDTVRKERAQGEPIFYGDATQAAVLEHAGIHDARVVVVAIPDPVATRRTVEVARRLAPSAHLLARTRYLGEMAPLYELGADDVVPEEFEAAVAIFRRVLARYLVPDEEIERFVADVRAGGYRAFRSTEPKQLSLPEDVLRQMDAEVRALRVHERSPLAGRPLAEIDLRRNHRVSVLLVQRAGSIVDELDGDTRLEPGDVAVVFGRPERVAAVGEMLAGSGRT